MAISSLERVLKIGSAGDSPAPVGDPPTGTAESNLGECASLLARTVAPIPSGESPDGTGGSPVLPKTIFQTRSKALESLKLEHIVIVIKSSFCLRNAKRFISEAGFFSDVPNTRNA